MTRLMWYAAWPVVIMVLYSCAAASAQEPIKKNGKLICGAFSAQPKTSPLWHEDVTVEIDHGTITITRKEYPPPKGAAFNGVLAPSGTILVAGEGNVEEGQAAWNYEFSGKLNKDGATNLKGQLTAMKGTPGHRVCSMSF